MSSDFAPGTETLSTVQSASAIVCLQIRDLLKEGQLEYEYICSGVKLTLFVPRVTTHLDAADVARRLRLQYRK
jgi:hypothetical protein